MLRAIRRVRPRAHPLRSRVGCRYTAVRITTDRPCRRTDDDEKTAGGTDGALGADTRLGDGGLRVEHDHDDDRRPDRHDPAAPTTVPAPTTTATTAPPYAGQTLIVSAASSLKAVLTEFADGVRAADRGEDHLQLRRLGRAAEADRGRGPGRRLRVGVGRQHGRTGEGQPGRRGDGRHLRGQRDRAGRPGDLHPGHHAASPIWPSPRSRRSPPATRRWLPTARARSRC